MSLHSLKSNGLLNASLRDIPWQRVVGVALLVWLSTSLLLDMVIMPGLYAAGMMTTPDFATAGYSIFWVFNRIEVLCAAVVLAGALALQQGGVLDDWRRKGAIALAITLFGIALATTYLLTPEMSALGLQLDWFTPSETVPAVMNRMHGEYFGLEALKLVAGGALLAICSPSAQRRGEA